MDQERDILYAWRFVNGYRVPRLGAEERAEWTSIIVNLSVDDWQRGCRKSVARPDEVARFRPSPMEFRAYARGQQPPLIPQFPKRGDEPLTAKDRDAMKAVLDQWRSRTIPSSPYTDTETP